MSTFDLPRAGAETGGGHDLVPLDFAAAEQRFELEPADGTDALDRGFDRQWALALLDTVLHRLEEDYARAGRTAAAG